VFSDKTRLLELIKPIRDLGADVVLEKDEEHGVFRVVLQQSMGRLHPGGAAQRGLRGSPEYRALYSSYDQFRELDNGPLSVVEGEAENRLTGWQALVDHIQAEGKRG
jgi:hypothetical protein